MALAAHPGAVAAGGSRAPGPAAVRLLPGPPPSGGRDRVGALPGILPVHGVMGLPWAVPFLLRSADTGADHGPGNAGWGLGQAQVSGSVSRSRLLLAAGLRCAVCSGWRALRWQVDER